MIKMRKLGAIVLMLVVSVIQALAIQIGMSEKEVEQAIGPPNGKRIVAEKEIWIYANGIFLEFEKGKVVHTRGIDTFNYVVSEKSGVNANPKVEGGSVTPYDDLAISSNETAETRSLKVIIGKLSNRAESGAADNEGVNTKAIHPIAAKLLAFGWIYSLPVIIQWLLFILAFHIAGAEADKRILFVIAFVERAAFLGVQWIFFSALGFATVFQAEYLVSFLITLVMVMNFTYAKSLPMAVQVVLTSKVAALALTYLLFLGTLNLL